MLAVLDHYDQARGEALPRDSAAEHAYLAGKVAYETGDDRARRGAVLRGRPPVALLRRRALLPRPHPGPPEPLRLGAPQPVRDRRAGRSGPLHLLHRRPLLRGQGSGLPGARPDRARAGEVRRRLLLLLPRPDRLGSPARRAVRGVVVDVPEGGVRGGARVSRGVRPHLPRVAAGPGRDAAARDDRPQVLPVRSACARRWTSSSRSTGRSRRRWRRCSRIRPSAARSTGACSARRRSRRRTIRSPICSRSTRASTSSTATSRRSIARPASSPTRSPSGTS